MVDYWLMSSGPFRTGAIAASDDDAAPESSAHGYSLRIGPRQVRLHVGETLIGRDEACGVVVRGALVSRRHARALLVDGELSIEDLGSTNGTFLNRARVRGRVAVRPGDRIFVGSSEIEVISSGGDAPQSGIVADAAVDRSTPSSGVSLADRTAVARESDHWGIATERNAGRAGPDAGGIESVGRVAERMFALGRPLDGRDVLSEPLKAVLASARDGRIPDTSVLDAAARYAMRLAQEVYDANWVNFAVEIHLLADYPMRVETLRQIVALRKKAPIGDDALIARYHARLCGRIGSMPLAERLLYAELANHLPRADVDE